MYEKGKIYLTQNPVYSNYSKTISLYNYEEIIREYMEHYNQEQKIENRDKNIITKCLVYL